MALIAADNDADTAASAGNALLRRLGPDRQPPAVVAHRGYSAVLPENTMPAFEAAVLAGAAWIECDVQTTADGVPVLVHDGKVDRTTDGTGKVAELTSGRIAELDGGVRFSPVFAGTRVPPLQDLLDLLAVRPGVNLLLELKGGQTREDAERIIRAVAASGLAERTVYQSFSVPLVRAGVELGPVLAPGLRVGLLHEGGFHDDPVQVAKELGVVTYNPEVRDVLAEPAKVGALHDAGIAVMPWTADQPEEWERLEAVGVDGIITNRPAALVGWNDRFRRPA